jgi:hypothetical protein
MNQLVLLAKYVCHLMQYKQPLSPPLPPFVHPSMHNMHAHCKCTMYKHILAFSLFCFLPIPFRYQQQKDREIASHIGLTAAEQL